jgi:3',5'-cyclic-AMP phosphodiesterase
MQRGMRKFVLVGIMFWGVIFAVDADIPTPPGPATVSNANDASASQLSETESGIVSWVHIGDLHITTEAEQNYKDLQTIVAQINLYLAGKINFAFLPGDNADDGSEAEYKLIRTALAPLKVPLLVVPGDHDGKIGSLELYTKLLMPIRYQSFELGGYHLIFLNALDSRDGQELRFGLGSEQSRWLELASRPSVLPIIFTHAFPDQMEEGSTSLMNILKNNRPLLVETGHTHFNAVSNDGHTIYAATRSTGQVKEGPVGFSITNLDHGVVSWKFKPLGDWPFVMITTPSDRRMITESINEQKILRGRVILRAKVWDDQPIASVSYTVDSGKESSLEPMRGGNVWTSTIDSTALACGDHRITVTARNAKGESAQDTIIVTVNQTGSIIPVERAMGADGNSIGVDSERGLLGTTHQPGPPHGHGPPHPHDPNDKD